MKKFFGLMILSCLLFCSFCIFTPTSFASNTATQTITITVEPIAVMRFKDGFNRDYLVVNKSGEIQTAQKELGLTTNLSGLSIYAQITEQPESPCYQIDVRADNINFQGIKGYSLGWVSVNDTKPTQLISGIGPGYGFYSIGYKANRIKEPAEFEEYTITFTLTAK